jgi:hypothetical protein
MTFSDSKLINLNHSSPMTFSDQSDNDCIGLDPNNIHLATKGLRAAGGGRSNPKSLHEMDGAEEIPESDNSFSDSSCEDIKHPNLAETVHDSWQSDSGNDIGNSDSQEVQNIFSLTM